MKSILAALLLTVASVSSAQDPVTADRLDGTWQMVFDLDASDADGAIERIALKALMGIFDEIDVRFQFRDEGSLRVMTSAFGDKDEDSSEWFINADGALVLGDMGGVDIGDTVWYFDGDRLVAFEATEDGPGDRKGLYLRHR